MLLRLGTPVAKKKKKGISASVGRQGQGCYRQGRLHGQAQGHTVGGSANVGVRGGRVWEAAVAAGCQFPVRCQCGHSATVAHQHAEEVHGSSPDEETRDQGIKEPAWMLMAPG